ncbi:hypothetical protein D1631_14295 [Chryseobacterium nematophagum]|uniref:Uncharacterized protein n=1 Tax=Chryseobacterium nematophagum TaxID=2305228 RepID=A0A3M7TI98_9FLAO|nr:hypothetical protein [Chryseobacterium nematophagum]RNA63018.1 hypothetical protein D1631_14295 [Chryseobacterium nematophagum]
MSNFIIDKEEFEKYKSKIGKIFPEYTSFEKNNFNSNFKYFIGFDFDYILEEIFFEGMIAFLNKIKNDKLIFYTLDPSPENYFFTYFNKYSAFELGKHSSYEDFNDIIYKDPGESTLDSIGINSNEIALFSKSDDWTIIGSRDWEIAIAGFTSSEIKEKFIQSFRNKSDIFTTIKEQVEILDDILKFNDNIKNEYLHLVENYKDRD